MHCINVRKYLDGKRKKTLEQYHGSIRIDPSIWLVHIIMVWNDCFKITIIFWNMKFAIEFPYFPMYFRKKQYGAAPNLRTLVKLCAISVPREFVAWNCVYSTLLPYHLPEWICWAEYMQIIIQSTWFSASFLVLCSAPSDWTKFSSGFLLINITNAFYSGNNFTDAPFFFRRIFFVS